MTNERAKSELMQIYMSLSEEKKKALDVAFKAMEQEPCEDEHDGCKDCVYQANPEDAMPCRECKQNYMDKWKAKANKAGHWKRISMDKYTTHAQYWYRCDRCGKDNLGNTDWCPNCGCRMIEPQEGNEKISYEVEQDLNEYTGNIEIIEKKY